MKRMLIMFSVMSTFMFFSVDAVLAINIGVTWTKKSDMASRISKGLVERLKELDPAINVEMKNELASNEDMEAVVSEFDKTKDGIVILRSNGAEWLASHPTKVPAFIGGCNHPATLGTIKNVKAPEGNVTGVSYYIPVNKQFEIFTAIMPELKSVLLLLEAGHPVSDLEYDDTKEVCDKLGIDFKAVRSKSFEDSIAAVKSNLGKTSAFIIGNNNLNVNHAEEIVAAAQNTPVLSYNKLPVEKGALGGFVADDEKLGRMLAETVVDVVKKGKSIKDTPVKFDTDPLFFLNQKTATRLNIEVPYDVLQFATLIE